MALRSIGLRIEEELFAQIESLVGLEGENRSEVIVTLLKRSLGQPVNSVEQRLDTTEERLAIVEQRLDTLEQQGTTRSAAVPTNPTQTPAPHTPPMPQAIAVPAETQQHIPTPAPSAPTDAADWYTRKDFCALYGIDSRNINRDSEKSGGDVCKVLAHRLEKAKKLDGGTVEQSGTPGRFLYRLRSDNGGQMKP